MREKYMPFYEERGDNMLVLCILVIIAAASFDFLVIAGCIVGVAAAIMYGDVIILVIAIVWLIRIIKRRKRR